MKIIDQTIEELKKGKVIVCPTDTVYGLIADATNKKAVDKIFKIKKRPKNKPLPIFVRDLKMAKKLAEIDKNQEKFLKKAWFTRPNFKKGPQEKMVKIAPKIWAGKGKTTVVLRLKNKPRSFAKEQEKIYGINKDTIALRIPDHKLINLLLRKLNRPLIGTSANISGRSPSVKIKEILKQFRTWRHQPDLIINVGNLPKNKPSKVIDLTSFPPKILRH